MRFAAFPASSPFLPSLARTWLSAAGDPSDGLLILPNRRSARALAGAFLHANQGQALLLPRIIAVGALDEGGLAITEQLSLAPAVPALTRQAMLTKLILARGGKNGAPTKAAAAWSLAADLASLLDEADLAEINLADALPGIVSEDLASHWQKTLEFLEIVTDAWPAVLTELGFLNPIMRQNLLIDAQARAWAKTPPAGKIWIVARDASPALLRLVKTIAGLPAGAVIFPGYDSAMAAQAWESIDDAHPQRNISAILTFAGVRREEVQIWPGQVSKVPSGRAALVSKVLLPAASLEEWQNRTTPAPDGIFVLRAKDEHEEASAIAMALRDGLEVADRTVALVTPDRALALRVTAQLRRFGIVADDSAGEPLKQTPPAILLRLLARTVAENFAPLPLLALLKHPLAANGEAPELCRDYARTLEISALRGTRPAAGFAGIKFRLGQKRDKRSLRFLESLEFNLKPIVSLPERSGAADALRALIAAGEILCATNEASGIERLWGGEAGMALSELLAQVLPAIDMLPEIRIDDLVGLLDAILEGHVIRRPRTHDGHPRVAIWGVQEASLQTVDYVVLAGLIEGVWPESVDSGPWMSRPMRKNAGLPAKEQQIGLSANDFFSLCCQTPNVIFAAARRNGRAPVIPARWLTRFEALTSGHGVPIELHPAASWAAQMDMPVERLLRPKPAPRPPAHLRPKSLSISDVATLMSDPYAIYLSKILRIRPLQDLDEESDAGIFGNIVHAGLAACFTNGFDPSADGAVARLNNDLQVAMRLQRPRPALEQWWRARLLRIAEWVIATELERRTIKGAPLAIALELSGTLDLGEKFSLAGRADRIERQADGSIFILDYKTGTAPDEKKMLSGVAPQLPLEAVMAEAGAFGELFHHRVSELAVWKLSGGRIEGEDKGFFDDPETLRSLINQAAARLPQLFEKFADAGTPYLAAPHPDRQPGSDIYRGISRRAEWIDGGHALIA